MFKKLVILDLDSLLRVEQQQVQLVLQFVVHLVLLLLGVGVYSLSIWLCILSF
jgi:hypothetical protein